MQQRRRVALVPTLAALFFASAGCGSSEHAERAGPPVSAAASCVSAVEWQGATYFGTKVKQPIRLARDLGPGTRPACDDGGGSSARSSVRLAAVAGVPPEQALAIARDRSVAYVAPGYFPQVPHTSLHDLLFAADATKPNERSQCQRDHTTTADVRAVVRRASFGILTVTLLDPANLQRETSIFPDARTIIRGGGSTPRMAAGEVIRARVLVCRHANDPHFLKLVATQLELPSPAKVTASPRRVRWPDARKLLRHCQVARLAQTHTRLVTLKLRDGDSVLTYEPRIDDIYRVLDRLARTCQPTAVATE